MRTALLLGLLLAVPTASALVGLPDLPLGGQVIVGYRDGALDPTLELVGALGADVTDTNERLGFVVARTTDVTGLLSALLGVATIEYVEEDDRTHLDGAQWNGAQWNGAQWNGAQWNTMRDQGAQWNGAQWNAHHWTIQHAPMKWSYDTGSSDPGLMWQWGSWAAHAPQASLVDAGSRGATLCVLDSGVAWDHADLDGNMWTGVSGEHGWNAIDGSSHAYDDAGHGTHIAGIAAAEIGNAYGMAGVGNVRIMAVKVLDANGTGYESDLAFGIIWCATHGADVAVMALSVTEVNHPTLTRALQFAADRDVLLLASAGNDAGAVAYPASHPAVMAVSAVDGNLTLAPFSNRGADVDLAAPGVAVLGTFPGNSWVFGSGTSQAVGFAAGAAALLRDADPTLTATQTRDILLKTATDIGAAGEDDLYGAGFVDVERALLAAQGP